MEERIAERDDEIEGFEELSAEEKVAIGKWFLLKSPPGQIRQVAKGAVFGSLPPLLTAFLAALFFLVVCSSLMSDAYLSRNSSQGQTPTKLHHEASSIAQFSSEIGSISEAGTAVSLDPFHSYKKNEKRKRDPIHQGEEWIISSGGTRIWVQWWGGIQREEEIAGDVHLL